MWHDLRGRGLGGVLPPQRNLYKTLVANPS
jgi:hypothetical protein